MKMLDFEQFIHALDFSIVIHVKFTSCFCVQT